MPIERKPSLFAQKMRKIQEAQMNSAYVPGKPCKAFIFGEQSCVLSGPDASILHEENVVKLSSMTEKEILEKREELLRMLKPENVEFLKKRRKLNDTVNLESSFVKLSTDDSTMNDSKFDEEPMDTHDSCPDTVSELKNKGTHMEKVEHDKLKWMEDIPSTITIPTSLYNARFDFEGNLLPFIEENKSTCDRGLYHHGEEPYRPGYTIEELYRLSRSSMTQQRIVALNTLASILEKEFVLSSCLETDLLKELVESNLFLILRFSLDESFNTVYLAALRALGWLFWRPLDMHYLSDMVGVFDDMKLPSLEPTDDTLGQQAIDEVKDIDVLKLDLIRGALRTDIVKRFRYIIDDPLLAVDHYISIIKCLTRICYHSCESTAVVLDSPSLLELLFDVCTTEKLYTAKLMVLFRVIACHSSDYAIVLNRRLKLVPFLLQQIGDTVTKTSTCAQCINLWHVLLRQGVEVDSIAQLSPLLLTLLNQLHIVRTNDAKIGVIGYASALVTLMTFLIERHYTSVKFLVATLEHLCCKWLNMLVREKYVAREFVKLTSSAIYAMSRVPASDTTAFSIELKKLPRSEVYFTLTEGLKRCSFVLHTERKGFVESLPSLRVPGSILTTPNGILVAHSLVKYCIRYNDEQLARETLNEHVWAYVSTVVEQATLADACSAWCARYEIYFLHDILRLCAMLGIFGDERQLQLAFTSVRVIQADDVRLVGDIFKHVIFEPRLYRNVSISEDYLKDLDNVRDYFLNALNLTNSNEKDDTLTSTRRGTQSALPVDWFYIPILRISNAKTEPAGAPVVDSIGVTLRWIYLVERLTHALKTDISIAARYCRVACVFFCGDVFLDMTHILRAILNEFSKRNETLSFKGQIPGISSFYDFYRDLCDRYASDSYCNDVFAAYVLIPLQQRHDVQLRKYVWTEQSTMLRFVTLNESQLPVAIRNFVEPNETNVDLVESYLRAIATGQVREKANPVMFRIGLHHVATFVQKYKAETVAVRLKQKIDSMSNVEIRQKILNYECES